MSLAHVLVSPPRRFTAVDASSGTSRGEAMPLLGTSGESSGFCLVGNNKEGDSLLSK